MTRSDFNVITAVVESITTAHDVTVNNLKNERTQASFQLVGTNGRTRQCWANFDGLIVGGCGEMAGSLSDALVAECYGLTC